MQWFLNRIAAMRGAADVEDDFNDDFNDDGIFYEATDEFDILEEWDYREERP
jgi:hypothetical protein